MALPRTMNHSRRELQAGRGTPMTKPQTAASTVTIEPSGGIQGELQVGSDIIARLEIIGAVDPLREVVDGGYASYLADLTTVINDDESFAGAHFETLGSSFVLLPEGSIVVRSGPAAGNASNDGIDGSDGSDEELSEVTDPVLFALLESWIDWRTASAELLGL